MILGCTKLDVPCGTDNQMTKHFRLRQKAPKLDFENEFSLTNIIRIFLISFLMIEEHIFGKISLGNFNFKPAFITKIIPIFWQGIAPRICKKE